jgi:aldose 1-epimerase
MVIDLQAGEARATVLLEMGGGVGSLDWRGMDILRPWSGRAEEGPFALGMNLLAPFSNRISGPFHWASAWHSVSPNLEGERFAIHGDAFQRVWSVAQVTADSVALAVAGGIGPWRYDGGASYRLTPQGFDCGLTMTNRGAEALPFGGGFHPWFPRSDETRLTFTATGYWPEDERHLPATTEPVAAPPDWRWESAAPLPSGFINAGFAGWDGHATIRQPGLHIKIAATGVDTTILYSPGPRSGFFCFEPVSHPVDAHSLPGQPGLVGLEPGDTLSMFMSLTWDAS